MAETTCALCAKVATKGRDWRTLAGQDYCPACLASHFRIRAVELPLAKPLDMYWEEWDARLLDMLREARFAANWVECLCHTRDSQEAVRLSYSDWSALPFLDPYPHVRKDKPVKPVFPAIARWAGCMGSLGTIARDAARSYHRYRSAIVWDGTRALSSHRMVPFPVRRQEALGRLDWDNIGPVLSLPIPALGTLPALRARLALDLGKRPEDPEQVGGYDIQVRRLNQLYKGHLLERQHALLARLRAARSRADRDKAQEKLFEVHSLLSGLPAGLLPAIPGEVRLYRRRSSKGTHRHVQMVRGESQQRPYRTFIKQVGWFPHQRPADGPGAAALLVCTDPAAFWGCDLVEGREHRRVWVEEAGWLRHRIEEHRQFLLGLARQRKYERRCLRRGETFDQMKDHESERCAKQQRRLQTFLQQSVSAVVGIAQRHRVGTVSYTDKCRTYIHSFPWVPFRERLAGRLQDLGVDFKHANKGEEDGRHDASQDEERA